MSFLKKGLNQATPEAEAEFSERMKENQVGGKDTLAMIASAFLVIVLPCLGVLLAFSGLIMLLFGAFS